MRPEIQFVPPCPVSVCRPGIGTSKNEAFRRFVNEQAGWPYPLVKPFKLRKEHAVVSFAARYPRLRCHRIRVEGDDCERIPRLRLPISALCSYQDRSRWLSVCAFKVSDEIFSISPLCIKQIRSFRAACASVILIGIGRTRQVVEKLRARVQVGVIDIVSDVDLIVSNIEVPIEFLCAAPPFHSAQRGVTSRSFRSTQLFRHPGLKTSADCFWYSCIG